MGFGPGDRLLEITGDTEAGFLRPKGNEGKGAAGQVAWGVRPDGGFRARALLPWEAGEPQPGHQISLGLSRSAAGMCGREEMPFARPLFAPVAQPDSSFRLHLQFS